MMHSTTPVRRVLIARHGETDWNSAGRLQGATDVPLNERGRAQAQALGELLSGRGIAAVASSPLARARETAQIAAAHVGAPLRYADADLAERRFGAFEGLTRAECEARDAASFQAWVRDMRAAPPGAEPFEVLVARMQRALARAARELATADAPALVVSHGQALRAVLTALGPGPVAPIANGAVYAIVVAGDAVVEATPLVP